MVKKSCQNSTLRSMARPLMSVWCASMATSSRKSSSSVSKEGRGRSCLDTKVAVSSAWPNALPWEFDATECDRACTGYCSCSKAVEPCRSESSSTVSRSPDSCAPCGMDEYGSLGRIRRNGIEAKDRIEVPRARSRRKRPVSSLKMRVDRLDQNSALSPKAAIGKAVAVPRWSGKFDAAGTVRLTL